MCPQVADAGARYFEARGPEFMEAEGMRGWGVGSDLPRGDEECRLRKPDIPERSVEQLVATFPPTL